MKGYPYKNLICFIFSTLLIPSKGCQIDGVNNWLIPVSTNVLDTFQGNILDRATSNIDAINTITYAEGLNSGPYLDISYADSRFVISTNAAYSNYEENETSQSMAVTVNFRCTGGSFNTLVFLINVIDTNNNAPRFVPSDALVFSVAPPLPPGFMITGCFHDITVRDIDLTTQRIEFDIEENPYFEIAYDATASTVDKEFRAILRTTTFIRNIPEALTYRITATDVDLTGDPPITTTSTVTINGDTYFEFPEEPVFSQAYYLANYTENDQLAFDDTISLAQGYHDSVTFSLNGEHRINFELIRNGNQLSLLVVIPLPADVLTEQQFILVVRADREYTSGDSATIIVRSPERTQLEFERIHYEGQIEDNSIRLPQLILTKGYENRSVSVIILGEHSAHFTSVVQGNIITLSMTALAENVINENNFMYLEVAASTDFSAATAIVTLEIIKDDNVTPVFDKPIYTGSYNPDAGLTLEQIVIVQGHDESISVYLEGEHASLFQIIQNGTVINLEVSNLPPEIFGEQQIVLSVEATKPRTVGANAAIFISLPAARQLDFEETTYKGTLQDNVLNLETIVLEVGYDENIDFSLTGDHATYFSVSNVQNRVTINLITPIPTSVITENRIIILTLGAFGLNAVMTTTSVLLDIIKDDVMTPVFARNIYVGTYEDSTVVIEDINLIQGFDDGVTFRLDGDHSEYFQISNVGNNISLSLRSLIPESVVFEDKVLHFNILADKTLTVGANAAVIIRFSTELTEATILRFTQNTYKGTMENNILSTENIVLGTGYTTGTEFQLTGAYSTYFALTNTNNIVSISSLSPLPDEVIKNNSFLVLEIEAKRDRAVSVWTSLVIDIVKTETLQPKFAEAYYTGVYGPVEGLQFNSEISLLVGYDENVFFGLAGEFSSYFSLSQSNNSLSLINITPLPEAVLENNNYLIFTVEAYKPNAFTVRSAIFIDIDKETNSIPQLRFEENSYVGLLQSNRLQLPTITLSNNVSDVDLTISGDYASYFTITRVNTGIQIQLSSNLPSQVIDENTLIILELEASYPNTVSGLTVIIIEIAKENNDIIMPVFEKAYYIGEYSEESGLLIESTISLIQGFNEEVSFTLDGEDAQWFTIVESGQNNMTLTVNSTGIETQGRNNLVFSIVASKPGSLPASAVIVISVTDNFLTENYIRFSYNYYVGSIEGSSLSLDSMSLEGYSDDVALSITGDYANYFQLTDQNGVFRIQLQSELPDDIIRNNNILILSLEAQIRNSRTHATIVLEIIRPNEELDSPLHTFQETYYIGSYNTLTGLVFDNPITLTQGYDSDIQFILEGEHSQWFSVLQNQNTLTLTLTSAIPAAVLAANHQLVFTVTAQRQGIITAQTVIVISLTDDLTEQSAILGFDRVNYIGSIENNTASLDAITLIEGYSNNISFSLVGEFSSYFSLILQGSTVTLSLQTPIPDQLIPTNRMIILEIQASAPQSISAYATIVLEVVVEDVASFVQLTFSEVYYTGSYNTITGLTFDTPMTLAQGYDDNVQFSLEGEQSQWFSLVQTENSVTLTLSSAISAAVLAAHSQLVFIIAAQGQENVTAQAAIIISLTDDLTEESTILGFDRVNYVGSIQNNTISLDAITLIEGYSNSISFNVVGEFSSYFSLNLQGSTVILSLQTPIPKELIPTNRMIIMEIQASAPQSISAYATIVLELVVEDVATSVQLTFGEVYYTGSYNTITGLTFDTPMTLAQGYDDNVRFSLDGEQSQWFSLIQTGNSVTLTLSSAIPAAVLAAHNQLVFIIGVQGQENVTAHAAIIISLTDDLTEESTILGFDRVNYVGSIQNNTISLDAITLIEGYSNSISFNVVGEFSSYFSLNLQGSTIILSLQTPIPKELIPTNRMIIMEIQASAPQSISAYATIVLELVVEDVATSVQLTFGEVYYTGSYNTITGLTFDTPMTLAQGYDDNVRFSLEGEQSQWFSLIQTGNSVTLTLSSAIPAAVLAAHNQLVFIIAAQGQENVTAQAAIILSLTEGLTEESTILGFDRVNYIGTVQNNTASLDAITLIQGYSNNISFSLVGELYSYFSLNLQSSTVTLSLQTPIPEELIPTNRMIILEMQASAPQSISAYATIVLEVVVEDEAVQLTFSEVYYTGSYNTITGLTFDTPITLAQGYDDDVRFSLQGEHSQFFSLVQTQNSVTLTLSTIIPSAVLADNRKLVFIVKAQRPESVAANATIIISITEGFHTGSDISFEKVFFEGIIQFGTVQHEPIRISEYSGTIIDVYGEYSSLFVAYVTDGSVTLQASGSLTLPSDVTTVILELHAGGARAVLLLNVLQSDVPLLPLVSFSSPTYFVNVDIVQTGLVGRVHATADNGERIGYSLLLDDAYLHTRLSINNEGELHLSAPANAGVYTFQVIATTMITQATANATVHLTVEAITVCGNDEFVMQPLIILDKDEEEPHRNLVSFNSTHYPGCQFSLTNRWPANQTWLYVDENGLHTTAVDREHESIAFMALSQVQVELLLICESDNEIRVKRSERTDWLGPYDYGNNKWILADTIPFNSRRSVVSLIVNDINDNAPIFIGKGDEPIAVGYPTNDLEESILPRSLAELQATDADIGENAALLYWSPENTLAVAPTTGFVHVRTGAQLEDNQSLMVHATDRNGDGLSGSIQLVVKILDNNNIAVVTVEGAFLDDEKTILGRLREAVGYDVKTLRSVVVSDHIIEEDVSRKTREANTAGASLQLYVYGLIEKEPVGVSRLIEDITNNAVTMINVIRTVSLEDHLEGCEISVIPGRDTGLLVATIVLSVLLFILIVLIAIWFFLRWKKGRNYDQFSDVNSLESRNDSSGQLPKPENSVKPRLNIQELKKSERRLQDMLSAPIENISVEPSTSRTGQGPPLESILDLPIPESQGPIVIQSIDKLKDADDNPDDEFGEVNGSRRKSVVTFNENVEKIIHVEDDPEDTSSENPGYEIYKL